MNLRNQSDHSYGIVYLFLIGVLSLSSLFLTSTSIFSQGTISSEVQYGQTAACVRYTRVYTRVRPYTETHEPSSTKVAKYRCRPANNFWNNVNLSNFGFIIHNNITYTSNLWIPPQWIHVVYLILKLYMGRSHCRLHFIHTDRWHPVIFFQSY